MGLVGICQRTPGEDSRGVHGPMSEEGVGGKGGVLYIENTPPAIFCTIF